MRYGKIGIAQGTKVTSSMNSAQAQFCRLMRMRNINKPAHFGYDIRDFNGDFPDFTKDFGISTEISGFRERFQISQEISGKVYEILVSGGPLGSHLGAQPSHIRIDGRRNPGRNGSLVASVYCPVVFFAW